MLVVRADGFVDPCISSLAAKPPSGPDWVHEVKHDGYRLIAAEQRGLAPDREV
jgi:bifunctional non-homologous end joining protein LigD